MNLEGIQMSRARLYVLVDAFERDIRATLARFVVAELGEETALGGSYQGALAKKAQDDAAVAGMSTAEYLDLREGYDLLNSHRSLLPEELAREVRQLTMNLDRLVGIRKRVMHARPLAAGDSEAAVALLAQYKCRYWPELKRMLAQLAEDPSWEPIVSPRDDGGLTLHNLPLPDYDETGLIGRAKELEQLVNLLKRGREPVLTITGEGGIGKTALALEVAYSIVDDPARPFDAVLWTSLKYEKLTASGVQEIAGAARDLVGAVQPLGKALDADFGGSVRELGEALDGLNVLVVVDNLETVAGADFTSLYDELPDTIHYLITSRLGVGQFERRYPLAPLSTGDSLHLFNDFVRARRISGLDSLSSDARVQVVSRLRFSPLAIRWFSLAVEAGNDPVQLIRHQDELLEFCVRSVYEALDDAAKAVLTALAELARPATVDELVVLLQRSMDYVNIGLQELVRGSLVRRSPSATPGDLSFLIQLTETATKFLAERVKTDEPLRREVARREIRYRADEERRAADMASRSLAPAVVRIRSESDSPTAQILRKALLASQSGDFGRAREQVELARKLNPDFWEVDRVDGFLQGAAGNNEIATARYQRAYKQAQGDDRAVVAHFFAGHLARNVRDVASAIDYAVEAHTSLASPETAMALGNYKIWSHKYSEGIELLEPAVAQQTGKARLIALSGLAEGYRRWAEYARSEEHNALLEYERGRKGLEIVLAAFKLGVVDERLRETGADCAQSAIHGAAASVRATHKIAGLADWIDSFADVLVRFVRARRWPALSMEIARFGVMSGAPSAAKRLAKLASEINEQEDAAASGTSKGVNSDELIGEVVSVLENYGFIRHPAFPDNVFFHRSEMFDQSAFPSIITGSLVRFTPSTTAKGTRAVVLEVR